MGRDKANIDWDKVKLRMEAGCSGAEIAGAEGVHHDTFYKRFKQKYKVSFDSMSRSRKDGGYGNLRTKQYISALQGNTRMLDKLGDEWLGQGKGNKNVESTESRELIMAEEKYKNLVSALHARGIILSELQIEPSILHQGSSGQEDQVSNELGTENIMGGET